MRGYYKKRIDELRAPSLTTNRPPSVSRLIPSRRTVNMLKGRLRKPGTPGSVPSKEDPRDIDATVVDKTPKPNPRTPAGPALPPGPEKKETPRLGAKPETSVGEPERRVSRQRREDPRTTAEPPPKTETPPKEEPKAETPPNEKPKREPSERWNRMSKNAQRSALSKAETIPGPEGDVMRKMLDKWGVAYKKSFNDHYIRIGTMIAESLGLL